MSTGAAGRSVGRYTLLGEIASGGMATVHLGRLAGPGGFTQRLAIKRLHAQFAKDPEFVTMFLDEARIAAHVQHANVIRVFDVLLDGGELFLVMEHVRGETLARLLELAAARGEQPRPAIAVTLAIGALAGLDAAHEARDEAGQPLGIVHRDVSPQNILVGVDGVPRLLDFGVAKAASRLHTTRRGQIKGKLSYMAPEQRHGRPVDPRADVYAMGVVLWELLTGRRLFGAASDPKPQGEGPVVPPSTIAKDVPAAVDAAVLKALADAPDARFASARDFAIALEEGADMASTRAVSEWVRALAGDDLARRDQAVGAIERAAEETAVVPLPAPPPLPSAPPPPSPRRGLRRAAIMVIALASIAALVIWAMRVG